MTQGQAQGSDFQGSWLVSEYVYTPSGAFAGIVRQLRRVEELEDGTVRVTQDCAPESQLAGGPMEAFAGHHVFDLEVDGRARRYLGPAVIGTGLGWGEGAMTGRGLWPAFGHNFTSFASVPSSDLQLTGGAFFNGTEMVANIAGVAVPQISEETPWPSLAGPEDAAEVATTWVGRFRSFSADGVEREASPIRRRYLGDVDERRLTEEHDGNPGFAMNITHEAGRSRVSGAMDGAPWQGLAKRYGWLMNMELCGPSGGYLECTELLDADRGRLVGLRRWWLDGELDRVDWITLSPEEQKDD